MRNKTALLLSAILMLPSGVFAYPGEADYAIKQKHRLDQLSDELSLSAEQKAQMEAVFQEQHEKFRAIHEQAHDQIKQILTPGQLERWDVMQQEHHERHAKNSDGGPLR